MFQIPCESKECSIKGGLRVAGDSPDHGIAAREGGKLLVREEERSIKSGLQIA